MTVTATGQDGATDTIRVTFAVTNVGEKGMVTLLEMRPRFGAAATSITADPDSGVTGTTRQGAESGAPDGAGTDINGATSAAERRWRLTGQYLRVTATHTDGEGSGKTADEMPANAVTGMPGDTCIEFLAGGPVGPVTQMGSWASDWASEARSGSYARYYTFKLDRRKQWR